MQNLWCNSTRQTITYPIDIFIVYANTRTQTLTNALRMFVLFIFYVHFKNNKYIKNNCFFLLCHNTEKFRIILDDIILNWMRSNRSTTVAKAAGHRSWPSNFNILLKLYALFWFCFCSIRIRATLCTHLCLCVRAHECLI